MIVRYSQGLDDKNSWEEFKANNPHLIVIDYNEDISLMEFQNQLYMILTKDLDNEIVLQTRSTCQWLLAIINFFTTLYRRQGFLVGLQLPLFTYAFYLYFDPNK